MGETEGLFTELINNLKAVKHILNFQHLLTAKGYTHKR